MTSSSSASKWNDVVQGQIAFSDFAVHKINFRSKAENLAEILQEVNLRPQNAVMIDDNPVERAAIRSRRAGRARAGQPALLFETHSALVAGNAAMRDHAGIRPQNGNGAGAVAARIRRAKRFRTKNFSQTLQLRVSLSVLRDTKNVHMSRALELFNKTNQFNTTGARYTLEQCHQRFSPGGELFVIQAEDRFTQYGLIGAAWVNQNCIDTSR